MVSEFLYFRMFCHADRLCPCLHGDQSLTLQIEALEEAGCDRFFRDQVSGIVNTRPNLNQAPNFVTLSRLQQETRS